VNPDIFFASSGPKPPKVEHIIVETDGTWGTHTTYMDLDILRKELGKKQPEQVRSPWQATVFVCTDPSSTLATNWLANTLLRQSLAPGQKVYGPMFILGPANDRGEVTDVMAHLVEEVGTHIKALGRDASPLVRQK
jgi:hypothetical protein